MTFQLRNIRDIPNIVDAKLLYYHSYYQNLSNKYNLNLFRMRIKSIFAVLLAIATMASCSDNNEGDEPTPGSGSSGTAYMSLKVTYPDLRSRASTEQPAEEDEGEIKEFYVLTFDGTKKLIKHANAGDYYTRITNGATTEALKVNPDTKFLLVVANPGTKMEGRLASLGSTTTYDDFNEAIVLDALTGSQTPDLLVGEIMASVNPATGIGKHFTMINVGTYDGGWPVDGLLDVSTNVIKVDPKGTYKTDAEAKAAASDPGNKATLKIERLASKMVVNAVKENITVHPSGAEFEFGKWILDYRNSTFFPYAKKHDITGGHTGAFYDGQNFYTEDPNYSLPDQETGIILNKVADSDPVPVDELWKGSAKTDYCIENTMAADAQKFGAATRVVIKGKYCPKGFTLGDDWFYYNGQAYNLASLKVAYDAAKATSSAMGDLLIAATDKFLVEVNKVNSAISTNDLSALTKEQLADIENGGEITKMDDCLWWYQGSLNYYYYEIRHDNSELPNMAFGKYGVARNNWYNLTLKNVRGKGTPWYPGGGPEDPDPGEDIDQDSAYLDFEIEVGPWIFWTTDFDI